MFEVNRSVVILKPRQPFADWLASLPGAPAVALDELRRNGNALLIPHVDDVDPADFLAEHYHALFSAELADWCEDDTLWPPTLSAALFMDWFDIDIHPVLTDLVSSPLAREAFQPFDLGSQ